MNETSKRAATTGGPAIPLHVYLSRLIDDRSDLTNVEIARHLGFKRPNVIAMIRAGSMKLPIDKVPALAQLLELDPLGLLRRALAEYSPQLWATLEGVIGADRLVTKNEARLLEYIRSHLRGEDVALLDDRWFATELTGSLVAALDRRTRVTLAVRKGGRTPRDSKAARANDAMLELLRTQAADRAKLMRSFGSWSL